ncbi:putative cytokinetic ring protein SteA [Aquipuribacter sp. MA13-6]|uniref:putative cytokinetic ring protein SteA n=1 Tax=unclassified Aquipuribacter TaxID=2635084 RepID=UPI003EEDF21C
MRTLLGRRRQQRDESGVVGTARVAEPGHLPGGRWRSGDVAVLDLPHLDVRTAQRLLDTGPSAVLLAGSSTSARYPHRGPELLLEAGVLLVDRLGPHLTTTLTDGTTVRVDQGRVMVGAGRDRWVDTEVPLQGRVQDRDTVRLAVEQASRGMAAQLEAFAESTAQVLDVERDLLLEGTGVPEVPVRLAGRPVVVVVRGFGYAEDLRRLRSFITERRPVLVGVEGGADALVEAGLRPDLVITDADAADGTSIGVAGLSSGAHVVVHCRPGEDDVRPAPSPDPGSTRFCSRLTTEDTAVLLAHANGADPVVMVGSPATLEEFLDRGRAGSASSFLTRLRAGSAVVDAATVARLHQPRRSWALVLLLVLAGLVVVASVAAATPWGQEQLAAVAEAARGWGLPGGASSGG